MNRMTVFAPAKLNLFLAVRPRRPDGFHEVETVTVLLELADQLEFQIGHDITESSFALTCESETPSHHVNQQDDIPQDDRNLVVQALKRLAEKSNTNIATAIRLIKRIPSQAGLGGGSSDAATTLAACCGLWNLQLDREYLAQIGSSLGSDVPLFLGPTYSLCRGRGEKTFPLFNAPGAKEPRLHFVLLKPCGGLNTGHVYSR
ncbi:MAG: hypothetical protein PHQ75_09780, partial [Thermoguttaceae bacterium]|nr:hypothetical protein [Thermoguttaceae bacterium]